MPTRQALAAPLAAAVLGLACAGSAPLLMTADEYRSLRHVVPYVLDISAGSGRLVYVGSRHTNDPESLDIRLIEELWGQFRPDLAFNEGGDPPTHADRDRAIILNGESGFVRHLAGRDGVPVASLDPTKVEQVAALRDEFSEDQLKLFFTLLQVMHHRNNPVEPFEQRMERVFHNLGRVPGLEGRPRSLAELGAAYREHFPDEGSFREVRKSWFDPIADHNFMNRIARRSSLVRNLFMVELLTESTLEGHRVFAVCGASHVVMQEAMIRRRLAETKR